MDWDEHACEIGKIVGHLLGLEFLARLFLSEAAGETAQLPAQGHRTVPKTRLTDYATLGRVIRDYNAELTPAESQGCRLDEAAVVTLRDSLAHGRYVAPAPRPPVTLYN